MYKEYADDIYRFIFVHVRDTELAEDLTADTFTSAWKNIATFDNRQPRAWLYTIARNRMNDHWRKKPTIPLDENIEIISESDLHEDIVDRKIQLKKVISALNTLPEEMKSVVTLRFMQGMSAKETARSLGVTEGNVRVMQYRALKKLKEKLG